MNLFECTLSSGNGGFILTVTCNSVFAGATITCTDGTTTLTGTCPSSSPYTIEFEIPNGGTWTVSGVYSGSTYSKTITITDSVTLNPVPTGSTVTPTDDIQTWLHCGDIWDKNYTTISAVLADTTTLLALISSNNAVDYMARSTTWASSVVANSTAMTYIGSNNYCANKLLSNSTWLTSICNSTYFESVLTVKTPTMTSATTPSGSASSSSQYSADYAAWKAFNGVATRDANQSWQTPNGSNTNQWLEYDFPSSITVYLINIIPYGTNWGPKNAKMQAYVNNAWVDAGSAFVLPNDLAWQTYIINNSRKSNKWRIYCSDNYGQTSINIPEMVWYGR